jgi:hypothetical protein
MKLMRDWTKVSWKRRPKTSVRERRAFVLDIFKDHLTLSVTPVIYTMSIDLVVIPQGMISQLHVLVNEPFKDHLKQLYSHGFRQGATF